MVGSEGSRIEGTSFCFRVWLFFFVFRVSDEKLIEEFHSRMLSLLANFGRNEWQDYF